jgi:hypothetical protein
MRDTTVPVCAANDHQISALRVYIFTLFQCPVLVSAGLWRRPLSDRSRVCCLYSITEVSTGSAYAPLTSTGPATAGHSPADIFLALHPPTTVASVTRRGLFERVPTVARGQDGDRPVATPRGFYKHIVYTPRARTRSITHTAGGAPLTQPVLIFSLMIHTMCNLDN